MVSYGLRMKKYFINYKQNNMMKELLIMMSKVMTTDDIIEKLQEAITEYQKDNSKESKGKVSMFSTMLTINLTTEDHETMDVVEKFQQHEKEHEFFKTKTN